MIYVHIGTHKTGTTSIQAALRKKTRELAGQGIYVPTAGTLTAESGHHNIAWEAMGGTRYNPQFGGLEDLITEITGCAGIPIISSEDFEFLTKDTLCDFDTRLKKVGLAPTYIVFFRRPDSYAVSLYWEIRKRDSNFEFDHLLATVAETGRYGGLIFDRNEFLASWTDVVGDRLVVRDFTSDVVPSFFSAINVNLLTSFDRKNVSKHPDKNVGKGTASADRSFSRVEVYLKWQHEGGLTSLQFRGEAGPKRC